MYKKEHTLFGGVTYPSVLEELISSNTGRLKAKIRAVCFCDRNNSKIYCVNFFFNYLASVEHTKREQCVK